MCDSAPHSEIEANVDRVGRASPCPGSRCRPARPSAAAGVGALAGLLAAALLSLGGCTDACLLNGECPGDTVCLDGTCRTACRVDLTCPAEQFCLGGGCRALMPGERPPCRDDAGCLDPDAGAPLLDAEVDLAPGPVGDGGPPVDGAVEPDLSLDAAPVDEGFDAESDAGDGGSGDAEPDRGPADGEVDAEVDGAVADGGPDAGDGAAVDLTGLYAVTTTVVVATGGELDAGDELRRIHHLTWLGGARHRVEVYTTDGAFEHRAEADFASPDGPGRYQFEYGLPVEAPPGCAGTELRFQRGRYEVFEPGLRLIGAEERTVGFDGEACSAEGWLVRVDSTWIPLPPP